MYLSSIVKEIINNPLTEELINRSKRTNNLTIKGTSMLVKDVTIPSGSSLDGEGLITFGTTLSSPAKLTQPTASAAKTRVV